MTPAAVLPLYGTWAGEAARAALVAAAFAAILAGAEVWRRRWAPPVEWTRKAVHFAGGIVAGAFPWLFARHETVLVLGLGLAAVLWITRRFGGLASVHGVERVSRGDLYFPVAVYLLFLLAHDRPVFYVIALSTLVVSDAVAAVLGKAYGRHAFAVAADRRTLEGSAVFLGTAFLAVHLPLLLLTDIDRGASVLIAAQLALLVTCFEAVSMGGNDNLVLPLGAYYLLIKMTPRPGPAIGEQLVAQIAILTAMLLLAARTRFLSFSGAVAAHLVLYAAFSLGGPPWIVAPTLALAALLALDRSFRSAVRQPAGAYQVTAIFYVSIVAVLLLFADNTFATLVAAPAEWGRGHPFFAPFVGATAAPVAILAFEAFEAMPGRRHAPAPIRMLLALGLVIATVVPLGLWAGSAGVAGAADAPDAFAPGYAIAIAVCVLGLAVYLVARRLVRSRPGSVADFRILAASVLVAIALVLPLRLGQLGATAPAASVSP